MIILSFYKNLFKQSPTCHAKIETRWDEQFRIAYFDHHPGLLLTESRWPLAGRFETNMK
jgi:hypothetical protein